MPEADEACCNLAEEIVDGCQIYIMTKSESCADGQTEKKAGIQTSPDSDMSSDMLLDTLIQNETGIEVHIAESPLDCVALGAGAVLDNPDLAGRRKEEMSYL